MKFYVKVFLLLSCISIYSCSGVSYEDDIVGSWEITFVDLVDGADGIYTSNFGCCEPGEGSGSFQVTIDGVQNFYNIETLITSSGKYTMDFFVDNEDRGSASCDLNSDGTGEGTYSFVWRNDQTGESRTLSGTTLAQM